MYALQKFRGWFYSPEFTRLSNFLNIARFTFQPYSYPCIWFLVSLNIFLHLLGKVNQTSWTCSAALECSYNFCLNYYTLGLLNVLHVDSYDIIFKLQTQFLRCFYGIMITQWRLQYVHLHQFPSHKGLVYNTMLNIMAHSKCRHKCYHND